MTKQIPKNLFDYGKTGEQREYYFINLEGERTSVSLSSGDRLHPTLRCPRDNVRLVIYSGDPHNVVECPNCQYHPSGILDYSAKKDLERLKDEQREIQPRLTRVNNLIAMLTDSNHPIKQKNLKDEAMLEEK